ncbi:unnamed protein product [Acanthoscelides obtectus]|uniref:Uncharacterized protein n=1 Tax=Acanthoscelides obtectus TaxID=200917 RepID=A0A9P0LTB9_ACAOB|nr:unnamed protein product [Acanthoscelides obtectus]CAK1653324.1 hypothetical protein AOBTE_LOCUS18190 [Acanthoscelides obtectus]
MFISRVAIEPRALCELFLSSSWKILDQMAGLYSRKGSIPDILNISNGR